MDEEIIKIIEEISERIKENLDNKKIIKELKNIRSFQDFDRFLVQLVEDFDMRTSLKLLTSTEYVLLTNRRMYKQIINLLIINLI